MHLYYKPIITSRYNRASILNAITALLEISIVWRTCLKAVMAASIVRNTNSPPKISLTFAFVLVYAQFTRYMSSNVKTISRTIQIINNILNYVWSQPNFKSMYYLHCVRTMNQYDTNGMFFIYIIEKKSNKANLINNINVHTLFTRSSINQCEHFRNSKQVTTARYFVHIFLKFSIVVNTTHNFNKALKSLLVKHWNGKRN